jgi:hypothetical protein
MQEQRLKLHQGLNNTGPLLLPQTRQNGANRLSTVVQPFFGTWNAVKPSDSSTAQNLEWFNIYEHKKIEAKGLV